MLTAPEPISVVIPVFNGERFLAQVIESVAAQTLPPEEIIIVDDGSTDASPAIAGSFPKVRLIRQPNAGGAAARNAGIGAARSDLVAFLDQDDLWAPRKLELQGARMTASPELGYTLAAMRTFLEPGCPAPAWLRPEFVDRATPAVVPGALVARKWVFTRIGAFDTRYRWGDDMDWFLRAREANIPMAILDEVLLLRRIHQSNASGDPRAARELVRAVHASLARRRTAGHA
jgi:glycosyltransferase involved in cell wall biosynthesis